MLGFLAIGCAIGPYGLELFSNTEARKEGQADRQTDTVALVTTTTPGVGMQGSAKRPPRVEALRCHGEDE